jgi:hypothetical protein
MIWRFVICILDGQPAHRCGKANRTRQCMAYVTWVWIERILVDKYECER